MTPAQEWQHWREKRERGDVTKEQWLEWAEKYVSNLSGGPWHKHCEAHIRFVRNT